MQRILEETLTAVETLLGNKKYQKALNELEKLDKNQLDSEFFGYYCILLTDANISLGIYNTDIIDKAIEIFRYSSDTAKFARAKSLKGYLLSLEGNFSKASEILNEAYVNYKRCGNMHMSAGALNKMAYCSFKLGNITTAINQLHGVINIFHELKNNTSFIKTLINLESLLYSSGKLNDGLVTYKELEKNISILNIQDLNKHSISSSKLFALLGDYSNAFENISRAKPYINRYPREEALYYEYLGWINILSGDYKEAEKTLKKGLKISLEIAPEGDMISQIKRLFGDLYIATEKYDFAKKYTKEALVVAEKIGEKVEIAACYRIFAQLEHRNDNKSAQADKAKEYYTKAIDLFKLIGSRYELAVTQYLAATSGLYYNGVRHAMLYMAKDYFESENIKPYLKKIEKALKNPTAKEKLKPIASGAPTIIAVSPQMKKLVEKAENVAQSDMVVLLTGETGTGKDLMAKYIHHASCRKGEFVEFNCPQITENLFEAELFGSVKGAFTGADSNRIGRVELANNGTLFLNEISEIPIQQQAKLLRVIETGEYEKVGSSKKLKTNCRVIAATNVDLEQRIYDGQFRADLYHRINEISIHLLPLCERREDIPELVKYFIKEVGFNVNGHKKHVDDVIRKFSRNHWSGNVRELRNNIKRLYLSSGKSMIKMSEQVNLHQSFSEKEELLSILNQTKWNKRETARILGVSEGTIRYRIKKYNLSKFTNI
ncbi:MAG: sigma 54-interacting transcriptional regulator [Methanosarcinaceae archaeon]